MKDVVPTREFTVKITTKIRMDHVALALSDDVLRVVDNMARETL